MAGRGGVALHTSSEDSKVFFISIIKLTKAPLCLAVALSASFGFWSSSPYISPQIIAVFIGIFLLACSAAGINSIQEIKQDARFTRTRERPLVTRKISKTAAILVAIICLTSGTTLLLFSFESPFPCLSGLFTLILYNLVYTPLRTRTAIAILPGGIVGALPPLIGWMAAGESFMSPQIWFVMFIFFLWQIPHYFFVLLEYSEDYQQNSYPNILPLSSHDNARNIILIWILAFCFSLISLTILPQFIPTLYRWIILIFSLLLATHFCFQLYIQKSTQYKRLFIQFNTVILVIMLIIGIGRRILFDSLTF